MPDGQKIREMMRRISGKNIGRVAGVQAVIFTIASSEHTVVWGGDVGRDNAVRQVKGHGNFPWQ